MKKILNVIRKTVVVAITVAAVLFIIVSITLIDGMSMEQLYWMLILWPAALLWILAFLYANTLKVTIKPYIEEDWIREMEDWEC